MLGRKDVSKNPMKMTSMYSPWILGASQHSGSQASHFFTWQFKGPRNQSGWCQSSQRTGLELAQHHLCHIPLVKAAFGQFRWNRMGNRPHLLMGVHQKLALICLQSQQAEINARQVLIILSPFLSPDLFL